MKHYLINARGEAILLRESETYPKRVIAWVPSSLVSLRSLTLPAKDKETVKKALPFALEDEMLSAVDDNHIAFNQSGYNVFAAVVQKKQLKKWQRILSGVLKNGESVEAIYPDLFLLSYEQGIITLLCGSDEVWMRSGAFEGSCLPHEVFWALNQEKLQSALQETLKHQSLQSSEATPQGTQEYPTLCIYSNDKSWLPEDFHVLKVLEPDFDLPDHPKDAINLLEKNDYTDVRSFFVWLYEKLSQAPMLGVFLRLFTAPLLRSRLIFGLSVLAILGIMWLTSALRDNPNQAHENNLIPYATEALKTPPTPENPSKALQMQWQELQARSSRNNKTLWQVFEHFSVLLGGVCVQQNFCTLHDFSMNQERIDFAIRSQSPTLSSHIDEIFSLLSLSESNIIFEHTTQPDNEPQGTLERIIIKRAPQNQTENTPSSTT